MRVRPAIVRWTAVAAIVGIALGGWAIPTFAGRAFVEVSARIVPIGSGSGQGPSVILPDGSTANGTRLRIDIVVTNRYPLPVLIDFHGAAFQARLIDRAASGSGPVWQTSAGDPLLEQADESPDGGSSPSVIRLPPGTTVVTQDGIPLDLSAASGVHPGTYALQVSAYGIVGPPQLVSIFDDALGAADGWPPLWACGGRVAAGDAS